MNAQTDLPSATVVERRDLTPDLMIMRVKPERPFSFQPGQYCTLGLPCVWQDPKNGGGPAEKFVWRAYSIASSPNEQGMLEFFFELVPKEFRDASGPSLTPRIWNLNAGDEIFLKEFCGGNFAKGKFLFDPPFNVHVMVATVTGIAPFISMLRTYCAGGPEASSPQHVYLFHGASYQDEFGYLEECRQFEQSGKIVFMPTVSRPYGSGTEGSQRNKGWQGMTGRVNEILERELRERGISAQNTAVYLCGNQNMIEDLGNKKPNPEKPLGKLVRARFEVKQEIYF